MGVSSGDFPSSMGQSKNRVMFPYLKNGSFFKAIKFFSLHKKLSTLVSN
jgi:hypothetical protein